MYYPYLRGKLFELILLRENAEFIAENHIHPIIEPVKSDFVALNRAIKSLCEEDVKCTIVVNPQVGVNPVKIASIFQNLVNECEQYNNILLGYILHAGSKISDLTAILDKYKKSQFSIIHYGFTNGKKIAEALQAYNNIENHIFIDGFAGKLYQRHLKTVGINRILIRDGFKPQKKNSLYPRSEHFSDLHVTFEDEGMDGFGDFLIVGDDFSETGGPAYAVAIHLTYLENEGDMYIYHFISDQTNSPTNPGGKFLEALKKLVSVINKPNSLIFKSEACKEFLDLNSRQYYPGLGYIKKLSMQHHIELIAEYLRQNY
jgi:hypothetical protein